MRSSGMEGKNVYVIGAGISGLIAAYELEQNGFAPIVLEKSEGVGGRVKTVDIHGIPLDLGFQVVLDAYPLVNRYLDLDALHLKKLVPGAFIYHDRKSYLIGDPMRQFRLLLPTIFAKVGTVSDKLKILRLNRQLRQKSIAQIFESKEQSTLDYLRAYGFSNAIIECFFRPFFSGIFLETELKTSSRMFEFVYKMFGEGHATIPQKGIGEISEQLRAKLNATRFQFKTAVTKVDTSKIYLENGEHIDHQGVIVASEANQIIENLNGDHTNWKSCYCFYFEVDQTNIPEGTIALIADQNRYTNNLYAYWDNASQKRILSATVVRHLDGSMEDLKDIVTNEVKTYTAVQQLTYIHCFHIPKALPDIGNLRSTAEPSESEILPNVYLAGDYLYNGSLNAAMQSGQLAAHGFVAKQRGIFE